MSLKGSELGGLLRYLHAEGCSSADEQMTCQPVVRDDPEDIGQRVDVVAMAWCEECGAADWEVV